MDHTERAAASAYLMIVERDEEERFQLLRRLFVSPRVEVIRDRRMGDRRAPQDGAAAQPAAERRRGERRAPAPGEWTNLGFFVARRRAQ